MAQAPDINPEDTDVMFATNVTGLINMTQAVLSIFKKKPDGGRGDIVNIGSIAGREGYPGGSIYCATKAAVRTFTDALRRELIATRIRVIEVDPGQVETEFSVVRFYGDKSKADAVYKGVEPLTPEDIAEVVVFAVGRRENVVLADSLIFPNHQVSVTYPSSHLRAISNESYRRQRLSCIASHSVEYKLPISQKRVPPLSSENLLTATKLCDMYTYGSWYYRCMYEIQNIGRAFAVLDLGLAMAASPVPSTV